MALKLYNRDNNVFFPATNTIDGFFTAPLPLGGVPVYTDDLVQLEDNSLYYGLYALLNSWNCVLSGCLIDTLNTNTNQLTMTEGIIIINSIVYYVPAITTPMTYPFSYIPGAVDADERLMQTNVLQQVANTYNFAIKTNFTYTAGNIYPDNITDGEIYFDPFTAQRAEYIIANINKGYNELLLTEANIYSINKTETGKSIVGNVLSAVTTNQGQTWFQWRYYGYSMLNQQKVLRSAGLNSTLIDGGNDSSTLTYNNLPAHWHGVSQGVGNGTPQKVANVTTDTITFNNSNINNGPNKSFNAGNGGNVLLNYTTESLSVTGNTDSGYGFDNNPLAAKTPLSTLPTYRSSYHFSWQGYSNVSNLGYTFWTNQIKYTNM